MDKFIMASYVQASDAIEIRIMSKDEIVRKFDDLRYYTLVLNNYGFDIDFKNISKIDYSILYRLLESKTDIKKVADYATMINRSSGIVPHVSDEISEILIKNMLYIVSGISRLDDIKSDIRAYDTFISDFGIAQVPIPAAILISCYQGMVKKFGESSKYITKYCGTEFENMSNKVSWMDMRTLKKSEALMTLPILLRNSVWHPSFYNYTLR